MSDGTGIPVVVGVDEVDEYKVGPDGDQGTIKRLIRREHGSGVFLGTFRLDPGQRGSFELPHANGMEEEIYYLTAGRLKVNWSDGERIIESGQAIFFPSGGAYEIETVGEGPVELVWTAFPPPA
ncbi:MAG: cupin domain-containing protein [Solirubrobacterales bacterium]